MDQAAAVSSRRPRGGSLARVPEHHLGRLLDHVHLRVADLDASKRFYGAVLQALGRELGGEGDGFFWADELFVSADGPPTSGLPLASQAPDRAAVARFHAAGGRDNGAPGDRAYHSDYHAAYALDPDGTNVEAVHHGPARRSAPSVVAAGA